MRSIDLNARIRRRLATAAAAVIALALTACGAEDGNREADRDRIALANGAGAPATTPAATPAPSDTIDLRRIGYSRGPADAPVTVYEFSDFGCGFCARFARSTYPELHDEFVASGKVRWTYVPFVLGMFPNGAEAARAAECAAEQDGFWEMHDRLFEHQREWKSTSAPTTLFNGYAAALELDADRFASCYDEDRGGARTRMNNLAADALRIRATPSFIINGRLIEGALPAEQFRQVLNMVSGG